MQNAMVIKVKSDNLSKGTLKNNWRETAQIFKIIESFFFNA
jgi:hypothetical protein